jgi:O-antigen/teichoic acid export membrane protein
MHEKGNLLARFVGLNAIGTVVTAIIGFMTSVMLARWLGPSDRGVLAVIMSISLLVLFVGGIGVPWAIVYYANKYDPRALFGNSLLLAGILAGVVVPAAWLLRDSLADAFAHGEGGMAWVLAGALVPIMFLNWTTHSQLQGMLLFGRYNAIRVLAKVMEALCIIVLLGALGIGVTAGVTAAVVSSAVMVSGALKPLLSHGPPRFDRPLLRTMLRYGSRVQIGSIFEEAIARVDILILQLFKPLSQVGYYVVAQVIAELVLLLTLSFQSSVMSLVAHYEGDAHQATTSADAVRHHGILAGLATLGNVVFGTVVILFAYGAQYRSAVVPMLVLLPGIWFLGTAGVIRSDLSGRGRPSLASKLAGVATAVTLIADFALIPPLGVIGAALASVIAYTIYGVISLMALRRVSGIPVQRLLVPTRADFAIYGKALKQVAERFTTR